MTATLERALDLIAYLHGPDRARDEERDREEQ